MGNNIYLWLIIFLTAVKVCHGLGKLSFKLLKFNNPGGKDDNGNCCDFWCMSDCDHTFTICLDSHDGPDKISTCRYGRKTIKSNALSNKNYIDFSSMSSVGDHSNPMIFSFTSWPGSIKIKVDIYDVDDDSNNDFVDYLQSIFVEHTPARLSSEATARHVVLQDWVSFTVNIKVYCDANYYGNNCVRYCVPKDDESGHYTCSSTTGARRCLPGWTGPNCTENINDCSDSSCQNGGLCIDRHRSYRCSCLPGYTGARCQTNIDYCAGHLCMNDAHCNGGIAGYTCACTPGWTGEYCEDDIDECAGSPCRNNGTCKHGLAEFNCTCTLGWTGERCEQDILECNSSPCENNGTCQEAPGTFKCLCSQGWSGDLCNQNIDECSSNPCQNNGICLDRVAGYSCSCDDGWEGKNCTADINECASSPCLNGGTCLDLHNSFNCTCAAGWEWDWCEHNIDECAGVNCNHGTCLDYLNDYVCECHYGYTGSDCAHNIDDCLMVVCDNNGICEDRVGEHHCNCAQGWTGVYCETNVNECVNVTCQHGGLCTDGIATFICNCSNGFDGDLCENDIDECMHSPCLNGGSCSEFIGYYICACADGWTGKDCETELNECENNPCLNSGVCEDLVADYRCQCTEGWTGTNCEEDIDECQPNPCQHGGTCENKMAYYVCHCADGWVGENCDKDVCVPNPCLNDGMCRRGKDSYICECMDGWNGKNCQIELPACRESPCKNNGRCEELEGSYGFKCYCILPWTGLLCNDNPCTGNQCSTQARCHVTGDGLLCVCNTGWTGSNCSERSYTNTTDDCTLDLDIAMDKQLPEDSNGNPVTTYDPTQKIWPATVQIGPKENHNAMRCSQSLLKSWFHQENKNKTLWFYFDLLTEGQDNPNDFHVILADSCGRVIFGEFVVIPRKFSFEYRATSMAFRINNNGGQWSCNPGGSGLNRWVEVVLSYQAEAGPILYIDGVDCELQMDFLRAEIRERDNPYGPLIAPCEMNICGDPFSPQTKYTGYISRLPQAQDEWTQIVNVLFERWHFPHTVGAIDGKHIALWAPAKSRSLVFVAHGAIEHCLLYETLASTLATHGCLVFAHDHAGSGQSEGPGLYADNFQHYVDDVFGHVDKIRKLHPDVPVFCIGQSMGGMITLTAALQKPSYFCGIVLTAPGIIPAQGPPSFFSALVLKTLSWLRPQMDLLQTSLDGVTRNQDAKDRLAKDPLVFHGSLKARWVATVMNAMRNLESKLSEVNTPFLVLHGNADPTASIEGSRKLHELAKTTDKTIKEYADCLHRLYDEPDGVGEAVHREIVEWIIKRC